jgi:hypothetical protein
MDSINNYYTYSVTRQLTTTILTASNLNVSKITKGECKIYRARDLPNSSDVLLYKNDPDPLIRAKHLGLGILIFLTIIPRAVVASFSYIEKWFQGNPRKPMDNPIHLMGHLASLLRWNLVGLLFPEFGRMHFGDEERKEHIAEGTCSTLTLDLKESEYLNQRAHYDYLAICMQPVMRVSPGQAFHPKGHHTHPGVITKTVTLTERL